MFLFVQTCLVGGFKDNEVSINLLQAPYFSNVYFYVNLFSDILKFMEF